MASETVKCTLPWPIRVVGILFYMLLIACVIDMVIDQGHMISTRVSSQVSTAIPREAPRVQIGSGSRTERLRLDHEYEVLVAKSQAMNYPICPDMDLMVLYADGRHQIAPKGKVTKLQLDAEGKIYALVILIPLQEELEPIVANFKVLPDERVSYPFCQGGPLLGSAPILKFAPAPPAERE